MPDTYALIEQLTDAVAANPGRRIAQLRREFPGDRADFSLALLTAINMHRIDLSHDRKLYPGGTFT